VVKPDRSRYIWVYANSRGQKERWQALADKAKTPLSTWCVSIIEERLAEEDGFQPRHKLFKEMDSLKAENKVLRDDLRQKEIVLERYEGDLRRYRAQPFQEEDYKGMRRYSEELIKILKAVAMQTATRSWKPLGSIRENLSWSKLFPINWKSWKPTN
jgi:hypothetical protein